MHAIGSTAGGEYAAENRRRIRPLKVALLTGGFPTASETWVAYHAAYLLDRGVDVTILARGGLDWSVPMEPVATHRLDQRALQLRFAGSPLRKLAATAHAFLGALVARAPAWQALRAVASRLGWVATASLLRQRRLIEAVGPFDVLHCHFGVHGAFAIQLREVGLRVPIVTTFHGFDATVGEPSQLRSDYESLFSQGEFFTANSRFTLEKVIALGCPSDRLALWRMGVHLARFPFAERTMPPTGPIRILTVARLIPAKGVEVLIEAIARLRSTLRVELHVVGGGSPDRVVALHELATRVGVAERVTLHGAMAIEAVGEKMSESHLFALGSRRGQDGWEEAQGVVLQEAQAAGLPVVTTRSGGIPDSVAEGESALLVPPDDVAAMSDAIDWMLEHHDQWPAMGRCGRRFVEERFDWALSTDRVLEIYADAIAVRSSFALQRLRAH